MKVEKNCRELVMDFFGSKIFSSRVIYLQMSLYLFETVNALTHFDKWWKTDIDIVSKIAILSVPLLIVYFIYNGEVKWKRVRKEIMEDTIENGKLRKCLEEKLRWNRRMYFYFFLYVPRTVYAIVNPANWWHSDGYLTTKIADIIIPFVVLFVFWESEIRIRRILEKCK